MILKSLISHEWIKSVRKQGFYKNLAVNIMLGFMVLYFGAIFLFLGFSLDDILEKADATRNPMELFNGAMFYILLIGLSFRFFMQQLNTMNLPPYQVLPIKRSLLVNYLLLKPLFSPINYFTLLVLIPFAVQSVSRYYDGFTAFRFVLGFIFVVWFNSQFAAYLKRKYGTSLLSFILVLAILATIAALEYFKVFSLFKLSMQVFNFIVLQSYGFIFLLALAIVPFLLNKWFFSQNYYPEKFNEKLNKASSSTTDITIFNRFGVIGELITVEIKLILRHKRTRSILMMSGFFLFYGLIFYTNDVYANNNGMLFFVAMFMTGLLMLMFGQWIYSWDSGHFDGLTTQNIPVKTYIKANYFLLIGFNILCFVLTTPYFLFGIKFVYMHIAAFIFNSGVNVFLLLFFGTYNTKRIDLSKSTMMNYQGTTFKSFLIVLPIMFVPMIIVGIVSAISTVNIALIVLSVLGLAGILFRKHLLNLCVAQFNKRKYALNEGFRQVE